MGKNNLKIIHHRIIENAFLYFMHSKLLCISYSLINYIWLNISYQTHLSSGQTKGFRDKEEIT